MDKQLQVRYDDVQTLQQTTANCSIAFYMKSVVKKPSMCEIGGYSLPETKQNDLNLCVISII